MYCDFVKISSYSIVAFFILPFCCFSLTYGPHLSKFLVCSNGNRKSYDGDIMCAQKWVILSSGAYSEEGHGPKSSIEWFFYGKKPALLGLFSLPEVFCGPQICQKCVGGRGSAPDPLGELTTLSQTPSPQSSPLLAPRFSRLRRSASVATNVKSWLRPCL